MISQIEHTPICIHLNGPAFNHTNSMLQVDLFSLSQSLLDIQSMLDRSYVVLSGTQRVTLRNRKEFKLIASNFKAGSLEIEAILSVVPTMIPLIECIPSAYKVIETTINAFELGKKLREWLSNGQSIQPNVTNYDNVGMVNNGTIVINNPVTNEQIETEVNTYLATLYSGRSHERLLHHMNKSNVTNIAMSACDNNLKMTTSLSDKHLFKAQTRLDDTIQRYPVKIHALDVEHQTGELRIFEESGLSNPVKFTIIGSQDLHDYSMALNMEQLTISALPEYQSDLSGRRLIRLHISKLALSA